MNLNLVNHLATNVPAIQKFLPTTTRSCLHSETGTFSRCRLRNANRTVARCSLSLTIICCNHHVIMRTAGTTQLLAAGEDLARAAQ